MLIREMRESADIDAVVAFQREARDYWILAEGCCRPAQKASDFFADCPSGCDPARSHRLGLYHEGRLGGLAELSFGFPAAGDAYLGLMLIAPRLRGQGAGQVLLKAVECCARAGEASTLYLAVLEANPRGRIFWERMGFHATGLSSHDIDTGHRLHRLAKGL